MINDAIDKQGQSAEIWDCRSQQVLQFWFPNLPKGDTCYAQARQRAAMVRQWEWWFRGGADAEIVDRFAPLLERATQGELDSWSSEPRSRLALILILDQFPRSLYRGTALAFAQDSKACNLALEGIDIGHYAALETPWEKTFFFLPLGHSESLRNLDLAVKLAENLVPGASQEERGFLEFSAEQASRHREIIARFGRHPHRNEVLGRRSTPAELEYLARGQLVHQRSFPPQLSQFLSKT
ncbi:MAG: DUF924 domain-containing protein [Cyanosarcina radialis HA8281-LM2]|jgi:uncharacterized protein (DUF924 family)|nr:DUF924 domain-containing protein [Cyanosarcina radialis HA8281-LM2]